MGKGSGGTRNVDKTHSGRLSLQGGIYNPAMTDNPRDFFLPDSVRRNLAKFEQIRSFNDLKEYLQGQGIRLEAGDDDLLNAANNRDLKLVQEINMKIVTGIETYKAAFGDRALSKLKVIRLMDNEIQGQGGYTTRLIGEEKSAKDGTLSLKNLRATGHEIYHELAHAFQDSQAKKGEDAVTYSERAVKEAKLSSRQTAYFGAKAEHKQAERFADAFADGFTRGTKDGVAFIKAIHNTRK